MVIYFSIYLGDNYNHYAPSLTITNHYILHMSSGTPPHGWSRPLRSNGVFCCLAKEALTDMASYSCPEYILLLVKYILYIYIYIHIYLHIYIYIYIYIYNLKSPFLTLAWLLFSTRTTITYIVMGELSFPNSRPVVISSTGWLITVS